MSDESQHEQVQMETAGATDAQAPIEPSPSEEEMRVEPHIPTGPDPYLENERRFSEEEIRAARLILTDEHGKPVDDA